MSDNWEKVVNKITVLEREIARLRLIERGRYGESIPIVSVYHNTSQSIANNSVQTLVFNSEHCDTDDMHDNTTNNSRLTCKQAGLYLISLQVLFQANATGDRSITIVKNGTLTIGQQKAPASSTRHGLELSRIIYMAVDDYVEGTAFQTSGAAKTIDSEDDYSPVFSMTYLGDIPSWSGRS